LDANSEGSSALEKLVNSYTGLGAPILFSCRQKELQWWSFTTKGAELEGTVPAAQIANFFNKHHKEFAPESIHRAKTLGRFDSQYQLTFVDIGLMPVLEERMGEELAKLMKRMLNALHSELGRPDIDKQLGQWLFQSAFWLLGAKILKDKQVPGFKTLDFEDVGQVFKKICRHYKAKRVPEGTTKRKKQAIKAAAEIVKDFSSLANMTIESLAYVYENTLITKDIRKALGIHATPPYLVDYIVWQLVSWIEKIPTNDRVVLEPTCGHAPFLVSSARMLREMIGEENAKKRHDYLKERLVGVELDDFAREIARLSLTLADVPNPNGWKLIGADVYKGQALSDAARKATILLCNPPFQDFSAQEQTTYMDEGVKLRHFNKAAEVLGRTLPYMSVGSVFGIIVPQGFLHTQSLGPLRELIVNQFELSEICALPENVFYTARHKSAVMLGRKLKSADKTMMSRFTTRFRRVERWDLNKFKNHYGAVTEVVPQSKFFVAHNYELRLRMLRNVWDYCQRFSRLGDIAEVGKGLEYKGMDLPVNKPTVSKSKFQGGIRGFARFDSAVKLTGLPSLWWMSLNPLVIRRLGRGMPTDSARIILNSARVGSGPWRLKALLDVKGRAITNRFMAIEPRTDEWSLDVLWAILNSPFSNAYAYCNCYERDNLVGIIESLPLPEHNSNLLERLTNLVREYFRMYHESIDVLKSGVEQAAQKMLTIDAEVMHLYNLPPRLERQVLDLFDGWERKGVDFKFERYFLKGFESFIPLHEYLSEEYQRSTVSFVNQWVEEVRSPGIIDALTLAEEAFKED
jgi:hypothetical protein